MFHFQLVQRGDDEVDEVVSDNNIDDNSAAGSKVTEDTSKIRIDDHNHDNHRPQQQHNFDTTSYDSEDSRSRPLLVHRDRSHSNSETTTSAPSTSAAPPPQVVGARLRSIDDQTIDTGTGPGYYRQHKSSGSLDSGRVACCTRLAFNLYHKAVDSAKKAIPRKQAKGPEFPRSFGEDFNSIGADGFNYLDDTATECSSDYRDIDFNRDSYYFSGQEVLVIPELPETEETDAGKNKMAENNKAEGVEDTQQVDLDALLEQQFAPDEDAASEETTKAKKSGSFMKLFKKKEGSKSRENSEERRRKRRSKSREPSAERIRGGRSSRGASREKSETRSYLEEVLNRVPPEMDENEAILSIHSRQSPVHLVYGRPPDIYIEEVTTLPRTTEEIEARKGEPTQLAHDEEAEAAPKKKKKPINMKFKLKRAKRVDEEEDIDPNSNHRAKSVEPSMLSPSTHEEETDGGGAMVRASSPSPSASGSLKSKLSIFKRKNKAKPTTMDNETMETTSHGGESKKSHRSFLGRFKKNKRDNAEDFFQDKRFYPGNQADQPPPPPTTADTEEAAPPPPPPVLVARRRPSNEKIEAIEIPIGVEVPPDFDIETEPWEVEPSEPAKAESEAVPEIPMSFLQKVMQHQQHMQQQTLPTIHEGNGNSHEEANGGGGGGVVLNDQVVVPLDLDPSDILLQSLQAIREMEQEHDGQNYKTAAYVYHFTSEPEEFQPPPELDEKRKQSKLKSMVGSFSDKVKNLKAKTKKSKQEERDDNTATEETVEENIEQGDISGQTKTNIYRETNLDEPDEVVNTAPHQYGRESTPTIVIEAQPEDEEEEQEVPLDYLLAAASTTYDAEDDDEEAKENVAKPAIRKLKLKKSKPRALVKEDSVDEPSEGKPSWSAKNKERLQRLKNRATESFNQFADKIKKKKASKKSAYPNDFPGLYEYEFKMVSDSEATPGTGVDSLRRSRIYVELADAQDRLDMYMQPVGLGGGPLRPPRGIKATGGDDLNRSMPALGVSGKVHRSQHRPKRPPPPRPPPPPSMTARSTYSIPATMITDTGDEISLSTSMCSLWTRGSKARKRASRQRVPADIFYKNVRLGHRPKKAYVEQLQRSHEFYSMVTLTMAKSQSTGQLNGNLPAPPPKQKPKAFYVKHRGFRAATSPPPPNSRTSFATDYEAIERKHQQLEMLQQQHQQQQQQQQQAEPIDPNAWQPFTWKVKRCRSMAELDARQKQHKAYDAEGDYSTARATSPSELSEHKLTIAPSPFDEVPKKFFHWLHSTTSLDKWQRKTKTTSPPPPPPRGTGRPPRPPPPPTRSNRLIRSQTTAGDTNLQTSPNFSQRPLPPPPVPPRPKLIPAHYANRARDKPEVVDHAVDTSENGFQGYHLCDKGIQVSLASSKQSFEVGQQVEEEDEETIIQEKRNGNNTQKMADAVDEPGVGGRRRSRNREDLSDDDTINDDISSISSKYESVLETFNNSSSWVHQEQRRQSNTTLTATDEYFTAADHTLASASNRSSMLVDESLAMDDAVDEKTPPIEQNFDDFQRQFTCMGIVNPDDIEDVEEPNSASENNGDNRSKAHLKGVNRQSLISTSSSISYGSSSTSSTSSSSITSSSISTATVAAKRSPSSVSAAGTSSTGDNENGNNVSLNSTIDSTTTMSSDNSSATTGTTITPTSSPQKQADRMSTVALRENIASLPRSTPNGSKPDKLYYAAYEIFTTERDYVDVLKMLTEDFAAAIKDHVSPEFSKVFFKPLNTICPINIRLLEELEKRLLYEWDDNPKVSDIILKFGPFFKEYSLYIRQYDQLTTMLIEAERRFPTFKETLERFQTSEKCRKLRIFDYLLKPIQRLQQYRLMLMTVQRHESNQEETTKAIAIMSDVVDQLNQVPHKEKMKMEMEDLMSRIIYKSSDQLRSAGRELVKHGHMQKMSRKEIHDRYLVLFNDLLLYLHPVMNDTYKLVYQLPLNQMKLEVSSNLDRATEFSIITVKRSFQLSAISIEEKNAWVKALSETIQEFNRNRQSYVLAESGKRESVASINSTTSSLVSSTKVATPGLLTSPTNSLLMNRSGSVDSTFFAVSSLGPLVEDSIIVESAQIDETTLGERAPVWIPDYRVTMCQRCLAQFNLITRRHHCRACGQVVCSDCSGYQQPLRYLNYKPGRVCCWCNDHLERTYANMDIGQPGVKLGANNNPEVVTVPGTGRKSRSESLTDVGNGLLSPRVANLSTGQLDRGGDIRISFRTKKPVRVVLIEVPANDKDAQMSGYLYRMSHGKKSWKRFWFLIKEHVLYTFMASEDVKAEDTLPLLGYSVQRYDKSVKGHRAEHILRLIHNGQPTIFFSPENPATYDRWFKAFDEASKI